MHLPSTLVRHRRAVLQGAVVWLLVHLASIAGGQALATSTPLLLPSAVAFDAEGNFYIAETANHVIRKVDTLGRISTFAGSGVQGYAGDGAQATSALLDSPEGIAVSTTALYIADTHNHRVRKVDFGTGTITTLAGGAAAGTSGDGGPAAAATLDRPVALALDATGDLFIADAGSHRVRRIDAATGVITTVAGSGVQGYGGDQTNAMTALLDSPRGIAVDAAGNIYVADTHNNRIRRIDGRTGVMTTIAGTGAFGFSGDSGSSTQAAMALPGGISLDAQGNIFVADRANHRIRRIDASTGTITTIAGDGTQGFSGDGGSPGAASLDSPRSTATSPSGVLAFADGANQRIRQVVGGTIQTVAGPGGLSPVTIRISGENEITYGAGSLTATLDSTTTTTGTVKFIDQAPGSVVVGQQAVSQNAAILDLSGLSAGVHTIVAVYSGDASHGASLSAGFSVTVDPRPLTAIISPASVSYGEPVPSLAGSLSGILPADQPNLSASYGVSLPVRPNAGTYAVTVALSGSSAADYIVPIGPTLTITRAVTTTTLTVTTASASSGSVDAGQPVSIKVHVASTTSGNPSGTLIVSDGATLLAAGSPDASGDLNFATSSLAVGPHNLIATYSGDGNFDSSRSPTALLLVSTPASGPVDFTLAPSSATTQTINSGDSANFSFLVNVQGGLSSPVTLSASGLPDLATASFNPGSVVPGSPSTPVTMTISTPATTQASKGRSPVVFAWLLVGLLSAAPGKRKRTTTRLLLFLLLALPSAVGCGDRVRSGESLPGTTQSYNITVTGSSVSNDGTPLRHTASVTLIVQSPS